MSLVERGHEITHNYCVVHDSGVGGMWWEHGKRTPDSVRDGHFGVSSSRKGDISAE
jgi:hypothetical protein